MKINNKYNKRTITFEDIREGTVFKKVHGDETYIKGSNSTAINLDSGKVVYPANDAGGHWNECYIFPRASLSLD